MDSGPTGWRGRQPKNLLQGGTPCPREGWKAYLLEQGLVQNGANLRVADEGDPSEPWGRRTTMHEKPGYFEIRGGAGAVA